MQYPLEMVLAFLKQYKLDKYCDNFKKYGINGNLLLEADDSALEELGITSALERLNIKVHTCRKKCMVVASSPGPTQILSRSHGDFFPRLRDRIWVGPGDEATW